MTRVVASKRIVLPPAETEKRLERVLAQQSTTDGKSIFSLRVALPKIDGDELTLSHDVIIHVRPGRDASGLNPALHIDWAPVGEGAYPSFSGLLNVIGDPNPGISHMEIDGSYDVPAGEFGELFDAIVGSRIAQVSLDDLLARLAEAIELSLIS